MTFIPAEADFDFGGQLQSSLSTDGTYRLEFSAVDNVGNMVRHRRTFLLDRQNIVEPLFFYDTSEWSIR